MYMKSFFSITLVVIFGSLSQSITVEELLKKEFQLFQLQYGRNYESQSEYQFRMNIYLENRMMIASHNQKYHQGISTFSMEINRFADRSDEELFGIGDKYIPNNEFPHIHVTNSTLADIPDELDWRDHPGYVNPVRDQGDCKSAWAFQLAAIVEAHHFIIKKESVSVSVQEFLDCSKIACKTNYDDNAIIAALLYQRQNGGIASEKDYPFTGKQEKCSYKPEMRVLEVSAIEVFGPFTEEHAMISTATSGPLFAAIDGIYKDDNCKKSPSESNFVVLIVGYGIDKTTGQKYWIVKNSWGTKWGEDGYMRMDRSGNNQCGIANQPTYVSGEEFLCQSITVDELLKEEFQLFQLQYGRNYESQSEYQFRMNIYLENRMMIASHNQKYHQGISTFSMEINRFADRSDEELFGIEDNKNIPDNEFPRIHVTNSSLPDIPDELDWRVHPGLVNPVKDQGDCKSAWALQFAAIVESAHFVMTNESVSVSVQEFLDCSNFGCKTNYNPKALTKAVVYQRENGGIASEKDYPYTGKQGKCYFKPEMKLLEDDNCKNKPHEMNFAVLIVGYSFDKTTGQKYWIVKNNWGTKWGEDGYMRMDRSGNNQCGIDNEPTYISFEE
ncbi:hypothetical protein CHUAL_011329 [Chamberlinius hualienensis]